MYAINHAATALILKRSEPSAPIWPLLISTQVSELLWVLFNYMGIEHYSIAKGKLHLDFLPYSHSVFSSVVLALISYGLIRWVFGKKQWALVFSIGLLSHVGLDIIFHEKDILLSPFSDTPAWGLGIITFPIINFMLELLYGVACWWLYKGSRALLTAIVVLNFVNLPVMFASGKPLDIFKNYPPLLPTFILMQIVYTWYFIGKFSAGARQLMTVASKG